MTDGLETRAGKPTLTTHPVVGGDALRFPITPPPPGLWWIALRRHATANPTLRRPWDQQAENVLIVECPAARQLDAVIDAVNDVIERSNHDYATELAASTHEQQRLEAEATRHQHEREDITRAIDERYPDKAG